MSSNDDSSSTDMDSDGNISEIESFHSHWKRISLVEISARNSVRKIINFQTRCSQLPSSWVVEIDLEKGNQFENFAISITLKRVDTGQIPIEGFVRVYLSNFEDKICPIGYSIRHEFPYFERLDSSGIREVRESFFISGHYRCLLVDGQETFLHDMLLIKAWLFVSCCCGSREIIHKSYSMKRNE